MSEALHGHKVLVTGGATGIGAAISHDLLATGAAVAVVQRTPDELRGALQDADLVDRVVGVAADLSTPDGCTHAIATAVRELGGLDALVNNAAITGTAAHRPALSIDDEHIDRIIDLNLKGVARCASRAAPHLVASGRGVIVSIASVLAHTPAPGGALYTASKAGVVALTKALAAELGEHGIRVVSVSPGDIATPSSIAPPPSGAGRTTRTPSLGRRGGPAEVAAAVRFLISDDASYITGTDILVDGGFILS